VERELYQVGVSLGEAVHHRPRIQNVPKIVHPSFTASVERRAVSWFVERKENAFRSQFLFYFDRMECLLPVSM
jgi:hypothetical protein